jgi:hypothetical protein
MSNHHTLLGQLLQMFPRFEFQKYVKETGAEYHARGFSSWNHFVSMLFGQLCGQDALRGIEAGLATQARSLYHLGVTPVRRSTLAYANKHRPHELFKKIFFCVLSKCRPLAPKHKFRFKNPLYSIDATVIDLCLSLYNWAKFRTTKGAVKLHIKLNHAGYLPQFAVITTGNVHEQRAAWQMPLEKGDVAVFDKGYNSLEWLRSITNKGVFFVTRLKGNADCRVIERRDTSGMEHISSDQVIQLNGILSKQKYPGRLRRIRSIDPDTGNIVILLTNNFAWSAKTIAAIYKERWQIELFFKTLKQQLKIKSFVGTSRNALLSQLWIALIAYLLLTYLKFKSKFQWSVYTLCSILPANLFARRNLWDWLNAPFHQRSIRPPDSQLTLAFG